MSDVPLLAVAFALVVVAGAFAMVETAISRTSRVRADGLLREGRRGAERLAIVATDTPRYLNVVLLLRMAAELTAVTIVADLIIVARGGPGRWSIVIAASLMTVVSYVLVGVAPRTLGAQHADTIALRCAGAVIGLTRVLGPLPKLLILVGNAVTPGRGFPSGPFANEAELRDLVDLAEERQVIEEGERVMIHSVIELGDTLVREVMVPRPDIVFIERGKTVRQALSLALRSGFSRIPVIGDSADDVLGVAYLKDLVRRSQEGKDEAKVEECARAATFVPDSKPVDELLREMQAGQIHIAVVIDEYGGTAGIVTIEDILEEIVGEIADEYDREVPPVERVSDDCVRVTARLPIDEVNELFDVTLEFEDVETVGGLLAAELGRVPIPGATVTLEGLTFVAESAKGRRNRIGTVLITRRA
ncbi:MAG TPA: hemolysin family protein [Mycobacteriales bacterium]|jgi:CBS domain containing-hemolysin-like protein|nr:hemolysin family protein [Mycobacteriales bacterium]